jgi:hypothetical protein
MTGPKRLFWSVALFAVACARATDTVAYPCMTIADISRVES